MKLNSVRVDYSQFRVEILLMRNIIYICTRHPLAIVKKNFAVACENKAVGRSICRLTERMGINGETVAYGPQKGIAIE